MKFKRLICLLLVLILSTACFCVTAAAAARPAAPTLSASNYVSNGRLRMTWTEVDGAKTYKLYRSETETGGYSCIKTTTSTGYTDTDIKVGVTYYYCVKAVSSDGTASASSNKVSGARKLPRPEVTLSRVSSSGKIKVAWDAVSGADYYRVYRSTDKKQWTRLESTGSTAYTDTSAEAGTLYYYRVSAIASRSAGNSAYSSVRSFTCDLPRPVVTLTNDPDTDRVVLSWRAIDGAANYRVYRATSKSGTYEKIKSLTATTFTDTTAASGKTYYYKVMAVHANAAANSAYSAVHSGAFAYQDKLTLTAKLNEEGKPRLVWNEIKDATGYRVYRSLTRTGGYKLMSTRTTPSYTNSSAPEGLTLYYKIKAVDKNGTVLKTSNVAYVTTTLSGETLRTRYVAVPMVKLYESPSSTADSIRVRYMEKLLRGNKIISGESSGWYRVIYQDQLMYLWMEDNSGVLTSVKSPDIYTGNTDIQQEVLDLALEIANNWKTVYAHDQSEGIANSDGSYGFDCSGFVEYVLETVMRKRVPTYNLSAAISVMHETATVYNAGYPGELNVRKVTRENLQPGDILFFTCAADGSATSSIGHCGIYLGNNEFVHSTTSWEDAVCIMPLNDRFLDTLHSIRRYLPTKVTAANVDATLSGPYRSYKVYAEMDPASEIVAYVPEGQTFTLLFTDATGSWAYLRTKNGVEGFTRAEYLS